MKYSVIAVFVVLCICGNGMPASAQTNINFESLRNGKQVRFLDNIEIVPAASQAVIETELANTSRNASKPSMVTVAENTIEHLTPVQFKYALLLDIAVEEAKNTSLYNFIDDWWGTRYRYGGQTRDGIDCSAFAGRLMSTIYNIVMPRTAREQYGICEKVARELLQEGDLVFFNTRGGVSHVGVYLGNGFFVHSSVNAGVTISSLNEDYYNRKYIGGGRVSR